jgi:hypothetical protein
MSKPEASEAMIADVSFCVFWWLWLKRKIQAEISNGGVNHPAKSINRWLWEVGCASFSR